MVTKEITISKTAAFKLVYIQLIITIVIALLSYTFFGSVIAYSVLLGSGIYILPNIYFVKSALRSEESKTPQLILSRFYIAEAQKFLLTIAMFALCFALVKSLHVISLFAAYILIMIVNLAGLAILSKN